MAGLVKSDRMSEKLLEVGNLRGQSEKFIKVSCVLVFKSGEMYGNGPITSEMVYEKDTKDSDLDLGSFWADFITFRQKKDA